MENEKIKRIAESLGFETRLAWGEVVEILVSCDEVGMEDWQIFNPYENDADCFEVLKSLLKENPKSIIGISFVGEDCFLCGLNTKPTLSGKTLNSAICEAYLATRGEDK